MSGGSTIALRASTVRTHDPMLLNSEDTHATPEEFCLALKSARERRGVTLEVIARSTKICSSHLVALERGDLRYWPKGLFRRAFFRGYVEMIGLPVAETMATFVRLFPDDQVAAARGQAPAAPELPLILDASWHGPKVPIRRRMITAGLDLAAVVATAAAVALYAGVDPVTAAGVVAISYFTLAMLLVGESPAGAAIRWRGRRVSMAALAPSAAPEPEEERQPLGVGAWQHGVQAVRMAFSEATNHPMEHDVPPRYSVRVKWP
jgi:hypothetical protein